MRCDKPEIMSCEGVDLRKVISDAARSGIDSYDALKMLIIKS